MNDNQLVLGIIFATLLLLLLVAGIFMSVYIASKQKLQQQMKFTARELDYEKELRTVETEVSETMMGQFARELHDNVGHTLTCVRLIIENKKMDDVANIQLFGPIEGFLEQASEQVKLLSRSLNSDYISNIGLQAAMQLIVERLRQLKRHNIHWNDNADEIAISDNAKLMAFRIFQEMTHNSIKHSKAKNIYISVETSHGFCLEVRDDGIGFNFEADIQSPKASGLRNMQKRAEMAGMDFAIVSTPGNGCIYTLREKAVS